MRRLGETETLDVGQVTNIAMYDGIKVTIQHKGPLAVRNLSYQIQRSKFAEAKRLKELRATYTRDEAPELYAEAPYVTAEGAQEFHDIADNALREFSTKIEIPGVTMTHEEALLELSRLCVPEHLLGAILEVQGLDKAQTFLTQGTSNT